MECFLKVWRLGAATEPRGLNDSMMRLRIPFRIIFLVTSLSAAKVLDPKVDESTGSSALLQVPDHHATRTVRRNKISNSHPFRADEPGSAQQVHRPQKNGQSLNSTSTLAHQDESSACKGPSSILDLRIPDEGASGQALSGVKPHEEKLDSSRRVDPERAHAFSREGSLISGLIFTTTVGVAFFTRGQKTPRSGATLLRVLNIAGVLIALGVAAGLMRAAILGTDFLASLRSMVVLLNNTGDCFIDSGLLTFTILPPHSYGFEGSFMTSHRLPFMFFIGYYARYSILVSYYTLSHAQMLFCKGCETVAPYMRSNLWLYSLLITPAIAVWLCAQLIVCAVRHIRPDDVNSRLPIPPRVHPSTGVGLLVFADCIQHIYNWSFVLLYLGSFDEFDVARANEKFVPGTIALTIQLVYLTRWLMFICFADEELSKRTDQLFWVIRVTVGAVSLRIVLFYLMVLKSNGYLQIQGYVQLFHGCVNLSYATILIVSTIAFGERSVFDRVSDWLQSGSRSTPAEEVVLIGDIKE